MAKKKTSVSTQVKVARISALQAVIVALITAVAGAITGYFSHEPRIATAENHPTQRWLTIERVESSLHSRIRIMFCIDGVAYSYPSKAVWAEIGPDMPKAEFPLPLAPSTHQYRLTFAAFTQEASSTGRGATLGNQHLHLVSVSKLPIDSRVFRLYESIDWPPTRDTKPAASVVYGVK